MGESIRVEMEKRFNFAREEKVSSFPLRRVSMLRALCLAVGISLAARDYKLDASEPFTAEDVLDLHAIVRHAPPELTDIGSMIQKGRELISSPQHILPGIDMLEQAMQAVYHIMGPHTAYAANAHQLLSTAYFTLGDPQTALQHTPL